MRNDNPSLYPALVLAYIGDAVYETFTRERVLSLHPDMPAHKLHKTNVGYVKASAQSNAMAAIEPMLEEAELAVYKRGRNAKSATVPKNADLADYRRATGFEALIGYLHLSEKKDRLEEIMEIAFQNSKIEQIQEEKNGKEKSS